MKKRSISCLIISFLLISLIGTVFSCSKKTKSEKTPIHINPNMDSQEKYKANSKSYFFANGSVNRMPINGVVATTELFEDSEYFYGKTEDGEFVAKAPVVFDGQTLSRGEKRFAIFCTPCHGEKGDGDGTIISETYPAPPSYYDAKVREYSDGQLFDIISKGVKNMPAYDHQIPVEDRWAIVGYVNFLQDSRPVVIDTMRVEESDSLLTK